MNAAEISPEQVQLANDFAKAFFPIWWLGVLSGLAVAPLVFWLLWDIGIVVFRLVVPYRVRMRGAFRFVRWGQAALRKPRKVFRGWRFVTLYPDGTEVRHD